MGGAINGAKLNISQKYGTDELYNIFFRHPLLFMPNLN